MEEIKVGLVGLGPRGRFCWSRNLRRMKGYRLVALCERVKPLLDQALEDCEEPRPAAFADFDEMLDKARPDAVGITTGADTQADLVVKCLDAGIHVMTDVPACATIEQCWNMVLAAERSKAKYQLAEQTRYWGFIQAWRRLVEDGTLGKIHYAEGEYIGWYGTDFLFRDEATGARYPYEEAIGNPAITPTWRNGIHPIWYLPHELSPLLYVLDDRVTKVSCMGTPRQAYNYPELKQSDIEAALMYTEKDTVMRLVCGFTTPVGGKGEIHHHWFQLFGSKGQVEWKRAGWDKCKMWLADGQMKDWAAMPWGPERLDAPAEARGSGHGDADYYPFASFRDAILNDTTPPMDIYKAIETAAPAILAGLSAEKGGELIHVPDFRPNPSRKPGERPKL